MLKDSGRGYGNDLDGIKVVQHDDTYRRKIFRCSNQERQSGTANSWITNLGNDPRLSQIIETHVMSVSIPNTSPNVSSSIGNDTFTATFTIAGVVTFAIPAGFYSTSALMAYIQAGINAAITPSVSTITQDPVTNRITIAITTGAETFVLTGGSTFPITSASTISPFLGFTSATTGAPAASATAPSLPQLQGSTMFFVHSNQLALNSTYLPTVGQNPNDVNGLVAIPVTVPWGVTQDYIGQDNDRIIYGRFGKNMNTFDLTLRTNHGRLLDLDDNQEAIVNLLVVWSNEVV